MVVALGRQLGARHLNDVASSVGSGTQALNQGLVLHVLGDEATDEGCR